VHSTPATDGFNNPPGETHAHEADALGVRGILWFVGFFIVITVLIQVAVWWLYVGYVHHSVGKDQATSALAGQQRLAPEPRLQPSLGHEQTPRDELLSIRHREDAEFVRRGWMDAKTGAFALPPDLLERVSQLSAPGGAAR